MVDLDVFPDAQPRAPKEPNKKWNALLDKIMGVWDAFQNMVYAFLILAMLVLTVVFATRYLISMPERNETDPPDGYSGLSVLIDNKTGCQYLSAAKGGITPRMDKKGKHMCGDN